VIEVGERIVAAPEAPRPAAWRRFMDRDPIAAGAALTVLAITAIALGAPILPLANPDAAHFGQRLLPPLHAGYLLGTDQLGRDLLSRLIWGARVSLAIGVASSLIASTCGSLIGTLAGFFGGRTDNAIMRVIDLMLAFPYVILAIALVAVLGPGLFNAMIAIAVANVSFFARNIRGNVLSLLGQGYIEAAKAAGATTRRVLARHVLPNLVPPLLVLISMNIGWMITETAGLSFLGLGAQPPQADWGSMLGDGRQFITVAYHVTLIPGVAIFALVLSLNVIGDALRDQLDPRLRGR
jgi:peptide/nickel transport system ATP-binding protein/peptide/nickel transport system permease protein